MNLTISFITAREEPHLDWLIDGLERQAHADDELELIVVDAFGRSAKQIGYRPIRAISRLVETRPKPTSWQGPHRITAHDFYANSNARNTAIVLCDTDYICFLDDRCKLDVGWLEAIRRGWRSRDAVLCGPYDKQQDSGLLIDHRREYAPKGKQNCGGGWCFGGNFALPLEWALAVNGFEEGCDPVGLEDCAFGLMLGNVGYRSDFVVELLVQQDRRGFPHPPNFPRQDKGQSPNDKSHALRDRFYRRTRTEFTPDLRQLRAQRAAGNFAWPLPDPNMRDWYDGQFVRDIR